MLIIEHIKRKQILLKKKQIKFWNKKKNVVKKKSKFFFFKKKNNNLRKKKKKKWKNWRAFKKNFLFGKKINFFAKIKWRFNNIRILWHQLIKMYVPKIKNLTYQYIKKKNNKFFFFLKNLELRLAPLLLRARFCYKLINAFNAIKYNVILINGVIINKIWYLLNLLDLIEKRRTIKKKILALSEKPRIKITIKKKSIKKKSIKKKSIKKKRTIRFQWRRYHWNKSKYVLWKLRRISHFNMYFSKKQNTTLNYLEINYKVPALVILKQPFLKELYLNKQPRLLTKIILKKIYFIY